MLNASGTLGISQLAGMYPIPSSVVWSRETEKRLYDLSAITEASAKSGNVRYSSRFRAEKRDADADLDVGSRDRVRPAARFAGVEPLGIRKI